MSRSSAEEFVWEIPTPEEEAVRSVQDAQAEQLIKMRWLGGRGLRMTIRGNALSFRPRHEKPTPKSQLRRQAIAEALAEALAEVEEKKREDWIQSWDWYDDFMSESPPWQSFSDTEDNEPRSGHDWDTDYERYEDYVSEEFWENEYIKNAAWFFDGTNTCLPYHASPEVLWEEHEADQRFYKQVEHWTDQDVYRLIEMELQQREYEMEEFPWLFT